MSEKENNLNIELTAEQRLSLIEEVVNAKGLAGLIDVIEAIKSYFPNTEIPLIDVLLFLCWCFSGSAVLWQCEIIS